MRDATRAFSSSLRNLADSGQSAMVKKPTTETTIVASPSIMKIHLQPLYPPSPAIWLMAYARS
jgi:hypothetical protein